MGFDITSKEGIFYYTIKSFDNVENVFHLFSTRMGWNRENTLENISKVFDVKLENIVVSNQVHGTNIAVVEDINFYKEKVYLNGVDGLITDKTNIALVTYYADCVPLFFLDPNKKVIGLAHGGWRGTVQNIGGKMINTMKEKYNSSIDDILVAIGSSIGPCCYEVGIDVYDEFKKRFEFYNEIFKFTSKNKWHLNLWDANKKILMESGIHEGNISISNLCTSCNNDIFYSYRKEMGTKERMVAAIELK